MNSRAFLVIVVLGLGMTSGTGVAQDAPAPAKPQPPASPRDFGAFLRRDPENITSVLKRNDDVEVPQVVETILGILPLKYYTQKTVDHLPEWFKILNEKKRYDEMESIAIGALNQQPDNLVLVQMCQAARIRVRLLAKKPKEGLALGKSFYNVCAMQDTSKAIDLIAECLYDMNADTDPAGVVKKFKLEQVHGAATTQPSASEENMLAKVTVDSSCYDSGLQRDATGWQELMGEGNLLLLSDKPKEAKKVFEKAYSLASGKNLAISAEAIARAMRAADGTVGRANAWILSLRPDDDAAGAP